MALLQKAVDIRGLSEESFWATRPTTLLLMIRSVLSTLPALSAQPRGAQGERQKPESCFRSSAVSRWSAASVPWRDLVTGCSAVCV